VTPAASFLPNRFRIVFAAVVFHRLSVERFGLGYYRVWVKPWTSWHRVELVLSTSHGVRVVIDGPAGR
jgi:hypothetical protein